MDVDIICKLSVLYNVIQILKLWEMIPKEISSKHRSFLFGTQAKLHTSDSKHRVISDAMYFVFIIAQSLAENRDVYCKLS